MGRGKTRPFLIMKNIIFAFLFILLLLFVLISSVFADELRVPFSCWPKDLQTKFAETGRKLDLSANDRTKDSWGYIESKGSQFSLFTYRSVTPEDFEVIQKIVFAIEKEKDE